MRLKAERAPNLLDRGAAEATRLRHPAGAPVGGTARHLFQRADDHALDLVIGDAPRRARTWLVVQPIQPLANKPCAPLAHRRLRHAQPFRHDLVIVPLRARENDPSPPCQMRRGARAMGQRVKSHAFVVSQNQRYFRAPQSHARLLVDEYDWAAPLVSHSSRTGH